MATAVEILTEARRLIAEMGWCRGWYARDAKRQQVPAHDPEACRFCAAGAISRAGGLLYSIDKDRAYNAMLSALPRRQPLHQWNDSKRRTKKQVLAAFDRAIAIARSA